LDFFIAKYIADIKYTHKYPLLNQQLDYSVWSSVVQERSNNAGCMRTCSVKWTDDRVKIPGNNPEKEGLKIAGLHISDTR
jgi:hypothetical protein